MELNIRKKDLIDVVAKDTHISKKDIKKAIDATFAAIISYVDEGNKVQIHNFGKFHLATSAARTARNPATGGTVNVPEKRKMKFTMAQGLKTFLNS